MDTVSVSDLKARLSKYLRIVRRGGEVQVLDRGVPIARITGIAPAPDRENEASRERLIAEGLLRAGRTGSSGVLDTPALELPASLADAIDQDRGDRLP
jgi:prevent-host-death family protein